MKILLVRRKEKEYNFTISQKYEVLFMSIFTYLNSEKSGDYCEYNGDLKDYILCKDPDSDRDYAILRFLLDKREDLKVCVNYRIPLVESSISNLIIRYRDVAKLDHQSIICPYIFYTKEENQSKALIVAEDYLIAKGFYYAATEKDGILADYKNFIIAIDEDRERLNELFEVLFKERSALIQRKFDNELFKSYDELFAHASELAAKMRDTIFEELSLSKDRSSLIQKTITEWYLLKKTVYVQYMVNRELLNQRHDGDNRSQRAQAKKNADAIQFISMSELWKGHVDQRA